MSHYAVRKHFYWDQITLFSSRDLAAVLDFLRSNKPALRRNEDLSVYNPDCEDMEGPMWDGEDVVTSYYDGLTDDERELVEEALDRC